MNYIELYGVKQNNLKNIDVKIPLGKFTCVCGPSGSGKSSLAFDTLYAEGQRRYIESMSIYIRQFLDKAPKPQLSSVENIPPAIAIDQANKVKTSKSTVGTLTELLDYIRVCFLKIGESFCPTHNVKIEAKDPSAATKITLDKLEGKRAYILVPISSDRSHILSKGTRRHLIGILDTLGYTKGFYKGKIVPLQKSLDIKDSQDFELVIDRLLIEKENEYRLTDSITAAYRTYSDLNGIQGGVIRILTPEGLELKFSNTPKCYKCDFVMPEINIPFFSFTNPNGSCEYCEGIGQILSVDELKVIPDQEISINEGAINPFRKPSEHKKLLSFCKRNNINIDKPWKKLNDSERKKLFEGNDKFVGIDRYFEQLNNWNYGNKKYNLHRYHGYITCPECNGTRLKKETSFVKIKNKSIHEICSMTVEEAYDFFQNLKLSKMKMAIIKEPLEQIMSRLKYLIDVGVSYLTLDRMTKTLSGGEYQRIRLASQLGLQLSQTMYVLDEPTVGLHPRDNHKLIGVLKRLKDLGNTLVVVEHDRDVIKSSDYIVEMGLHSGNFGGEIMYSGEISNFLKSCPTITSKIINNKIPKRVIRRKSVNSDTKFISVSNCRGHNLKNISVRLPVNSFVTVTGVSGSGKSSLINHTLYPALKYKLTGQLSSELEYESLDGFIGLDDVILIDQDTIGRTLRSMPATYVGIYDEIRKGMSELEYSKKNGYSASYFSINLVGGRCDTCEGTGFVTEDMGFMDDIKIICEDCNGKKFKKGILRARLRGKNIYDILNLTVNEALDFFKENKNIKRTLQILQKVGLGYLKIGQSTKDLSGGESQRLKISKELNTSKRGKIMYLLDEPTVGLHPNEISMLLDIIDSLIEFGSSVVVIEHNLDMIAASDYIIELGPGGGKYGGSVVFQGSTMDILKNPKSATAPYLKEYLV